MGFQLSLAQERHDCPSSETPSLGCIIINAAGFCNNVLSYRAGLLTLRPTPNPEGQGNISLFALYPSTCSAWVALPGVQYSIRQSSRGHRGTQTIPPW